MFRTERLMPAAACALFILISLTPVYPQEESEALESALAVQNAFEELADKVVNNRAKNGKSWRQKGDELKSTGCHQMTL